MGKFEDFLLFPTRIFWFDLVTYILTNITRLRELNKASEKININMNKNNFIVIYIINGRNVITISFTVQLFSNHLIYTYINNKWNKKTSRKTKYHNQILYVSETLNYVNKSK